MKTINIEDINTIYQKLNIHRDLLDPYAQSIVNQVISLYYEEVFKHRETSLEYISLLGQFQEEVEKHLKTVNVKLVKEFAEFLENKFNQP